MAVLDDLGFNSFGRQRPAPLYGGQPTAPTAAPKPPAYTQPAINMPRVTPRMEAPDGDSPFPFPGAPNAPAPPPTTPPPPTNRPYTGLNTNAILDFLRSGGYSFHTGDNGLAAALQPLIAAGLLPEGSTIFGSKSDKLRLPTGLIFDMIEAAGLGGRGWQMINDSGPSSFFDDPIGNWFASGIGDILAQLRVPRELPSQVNDAYSILRQLSTSGGGVDLGNLRALTTQRVNELNQEPFSATEEAARRVQAFDNLERSRQVAIQQTIERLGARGHGLSSGTVESAIQEVNATFDALRAQNENQLLMGAIGERQRRRSEAVGLEQGFADRALQASQAATSTRTSAAQALAALAEFISASMDPAQRLALMLQGYGAIPDYAQQQFENAAGQVG